MEDKEKIPAGEPRFVLDWVYLVKLKTPTQDIAKFLPALKSSLSHLFILMVLLDLEVMILLLSCK